MLDLPFADPTFDVVVSAWVIETVPDPLREVTEYLRVIKPEGQVVYTFCSLPVGLTTEVELQRCCSVAAPVLPAPA